MKKYFLYFLSLLVWTPSDARTWREIPYYLAEYEYLYSQSPKEAAMQWFKDARFGLFIHWGPASLYKADSWAMYNKRVPVSEYEETARHFSGSHFNAAEYVALAKKAHMKYITFVVKHHDGFAMWDSKATDWDSMDYPCHRDFLGELADECQKNGIGLFIYYSIGLDWHHPYFMPNTMYDPARPHYDKPEPRYKYADVEDFEHYMNFAKTQILELCTNYGPVAGFWFDTVGGVYQYPDMFNIQDIYDMIHTIQPHALVVFKTGANGNEDFITGEREMGSLSGVFKSVGLPREVWEAADHSWESNKNKPAELNIPIQSLGWGYYESPDQRHMDSAEIIALLNRCADMNANLLLNIGPRPDGTIIEENINELVKVGKYIEANGLPALNTTDYMKYRTSSEVKLDTEAVNQTAR